jgi:hypothetical protein
MRIDGEKLGNDPQAARPGVTTHEVGVADLLSLDHPHT